MAGWGTAVAGALALGFILRQVLAPFVLALAFTYVVEPPVSALHNRGLNRIFSILVVYALVALLVGAVVVFVVPQFLAELGTLSTDMPRYVDNLTAILDSWQDRYAAFPLPDGIRTAVDDGIRKLEERSHAAITRTVESVVGFATGAWTLILVPFLAFYMLKDADHFRRLFLSWLPASTRFQWLRLMRDCDQVLSGFIRGQVIIAVIIGTSMAVVAALLKLPYALLLGITAGLGEFVPYFGPIIGSVPAIVFAANQSSQTLLQLMMAIIIIHQLEQAVLFPLILGESVGMHPLLVIFSLLIGGHFFGLAGLILALPVAGIIRALWRFFSRFPPEGGPPSLREDEPAEVSSP